MRHHHAGIFVKDMEQSLKFYRDVLGFKPFLDRMLPDAELGYPPDVLDEVFRFKNSSSRMVLALSDEGSMLELQEPAYKEFKPSPATPRVYEYGGILEFAIAVDDVEYWFHRVREAGYETLMDRIRDAAGLVRTFSVFDPDGNIVQILQQTAKFPD